MFSRWSVQFLVVASSSWFVAVVFGYGKHHHPRAWPARPRKFWKPHHQVSMTIVQLVDINFVISQLKMLVRPPNPAPVAHASCSPPAHSTESLLTTATTLRQSRGSVHLRAVVGTRKHGFYSLNLPVIMIIDSRSKSKFDIDILE